MSKRQAVDTVTSSAKKVKSAAITSFFKQDGVSQSSTPRAAAAPVKKFVKAEWLETLKPSEKELLDLEIKTLDESWLSVLSQELTKPYFLKLKEYLKKERASQTVFPPEKDVYSWSRHTPFDRVKVVIIGQDPYHNVGQAHGLCFSVQSPCPAPPSLKNMYKALKVDYPTFVVPKHGSLLGWADQGVLLLNTCLTVRAHQANSHQKQGWEQFTQKVLDVVAAHREKGVVFMAWGKPASERVKKIDTKKHLKLESVHPSPLSAARGFFECKHFIKSNDWLTTRYGIEEVINWNCLADSPSGLSGNAVPVTQASSKEPVVPHETVDGTAVDAEKPAPLEHEESFAVSKEEEELMAAAQEDLDASSKAEETSVDNNV
ncbi:protein of unknown function [Taphrina deformans PYCC 5710]|uniref:Uracil-DNA glycosylase n=1 Tax=Taphrina deformans (strain PYCC 5710 / ATCC 11124 / CBS 356.35 / IMI 108563 / JCM 9778 / NBRC 8474) TaxID=1097556 RepID=R4XNH0_TAPDE|nr:protein of unknown function [Taphrina deformans PYCC 5710]|eukprot:CCG84789.1 protein of unknown function [Taphrina deformans PYCC 5710]